MASQGVAQGGFDMGMRCLAVIVFLTFVFAGTYFAKVRNPPQILLGYILGGIGFALGRKFWKIKGGK